MANDKDFKTIYTLKIKQELKKLGFEPILEKDNPKKPTFKCWVYEWTPEFIDAFTSVTKKGGSRNDRV